MCWEYKRNVSWCLLTTSLCSGGVWIPGLTETSSAQSLWWPITEECWMLGAKQILKYTFYSQPKLSFLFDLWCGGQPHQDFKFVLQGWTKSNQLCFTTRAFRNSSLEHNWPSWKWQILLICFFSSLLPAGIETLLRKRFRKHKGRKCNLYKCRCMELSFWLLSNWTNI